MHDLTLSVTQLTLTREYDTGEVAGSAVATGFFWRDAGKPYIISNWHNFSGINQQTGKYLSQFAPNWLQLNLAYRGKDIDGELFWIHNFPYKVPLLAREEPLWMEHPRGREVDCAALPIIIPKLEKNLNKFVNEISTFNALLEPYEGADCFVVGYPMGLQGPGSTPWKRASIATDPFQDIAGQPLFLIDTATRKGMSGSPVIVRHRGVLNPKEPSDFRLGTVENFVGVYSGRVDDDPLGVQIGRVWKAAVVGEIFGERAPGADPTAQANNDRPNGIVGSMLDNLQATEEI